jgi:hypothetical protein
MNESKGPIKTYLKSQYHITPPLRRTPVSSWALLYRDEPTRTTWRALFTVNPQAASILDGHGLDDNRYAVIAPVGHPGI